MNDIMKYEAVIGLEVHAQLLTNTKIFCNCNNKFGAEANTHTCPVCLGLPGALPVLNEKAIEYVIIMGLATDCEIAKESIFARKNYFYPDLPKGYQISQFEKPVCENGWIDVMVNDKVRRVRIHRIHLEEDAGKSVHEEKYVDQESSLIDLNRCGTPLIEIVSEPDIRHPEEAAEYMRNLRQLVIYLAICDGNMEEGSLRCDANISLRPKGTTKLGTKTELKNMNSFRNVEKALHAEIHRQNKILDNGDIIKQATLLWDADKSEIQVMRTKEEAHDYRYFPEPDLVKLEITDAYIDTIKNDIPELPAQKIKKYVDELRLPLYDSEIITAQPLMANYFESVLTYIDKPKLISNWLLGEISRYINDQKISIADFPIAPEKFAELLGYVDAKEISGNAAKRVFDEMLISKESADQIITRLQLKQVSDSSVLESMIDEVLSQNSGQVKEYKNGKEQLLGFFVGQVMKASKGQANPKVVNEILRNKLAH